MASALENEMSFPFKCEFCDNVGIDKCKQCFVVYYCCKEHQLQHWPIHQKTCKKSSDLPLSSKENQPISPDGSQNLNKAEKPSPNKLNEAEEGSPSNQKGKETKPIECLKSACEKFIKEMSSLGICVFDNFMGSINGNLVLKEVESLYHEGIFQKGKLVRAHPTIPSESFRSDVVTWLKDPEPEYPYIAALLQKIGYLIHTTNNMSQNGLFSRYSLSTRSRVMIACYPGNGSHYMKHVDNPSRDGRCVTSVYYLNRNWDKAHGGILRAYPRVSSQYHDIEPIFDRLVTFWSNERVPHEVLPAFATRFAITVWYFDKDEWDESLRMRGLKRLKK